jgi:hypothetical protein
MSVYLPNPINAIYNPWAINANYLLWPIKDKLYVPLPGTIAPVLGAYQAKQQAGISELFVPAES